MPLNLPQALAAAVQALQSNQLFQAQSLLQQILQEHPDNAEALRLSGFLAHAHGRIPDAAAALERSLQFEPNNEVALCNLGEIYRVLNRLPEAEAACRKALHVSPDFAAALFNLGTILIAQGRQLDAIPFLVRAVTLQPQNAQASIRLAAALKDLNRFDEALGVCRQALAIDPNNADMHNCVGTIEFAQNHLDLAIAGYLRAIQINPNHLAALNNLSGIYLQLGRHAESLAAAQRAYQLEPTVPEIILTYTEALQNNGQAAAVIPILTPVLQKNPGLVAAYNSLGNAYHRLGDFPNAIAIYEKGVALDPDFPRMPNNLALALYKNNQAEQAIALLEGVLGKPGGENNPVGHFHLALARLHLGDLRRGFQEYEWRWKCVEYQSTRPITKDPEWRGQDLTGKTLLLHAEQGFGDSLQFIRYVPLLAKGDRFGKPAAIWLEAQPEVRGLLETVTGLDRTFARLSPIPNCDFQCTLLSLPRIFGTDLATVPADVPYLSADPDRIAYWKKEIEKVETARPAPPRLRVALSWAGEPGHMDDSRRSCPLAHFAPLAAIPGLAFYSLQKGLGAAQLQSAPFPIHDFMPRVTNFADSAALVSNFDLILSVDTAPAHLAGALAKKVWLLLSYSGEWRWMKNRPDSPWYPTMRLFRQPRHGEWQSVFQNVTAALHDLVTSKKSV